MRCMLSLSSWRAWIEIPYDLASSSQIVSLSSWRAWIEIILRAEWNGLVDVALLMESVD